ncbi:MAG: hypothetical protein AB1437_09680 [Pseudomonadota bacterium]
MDSIDRKQPEANRRDRRGGDAVERLREIVHDRQRHGDTVAGAKVVVGAVIGKTLDDSIEGTLTF